MVAAVVVGPFGTPAKGADCATVVLELLETYRALAEGETAPGDLISTLEDAIIVTPSCAPALIGAAVGVLDGDHDLIQQVVQSALEIAPEQTDQIIAVAQQASHESDDAVAVAAAKCTRPGSPTPPTDLIPTSGGERVTVTTDEAPPAIAWVQFPARQIEEIGSPDLIWEPVNEPIEVALRLGAGFDGNSSTSPESVNSSYLRGGLGAKIQRTLSNAQWELTADYTYLEYLNNAPGLREGNHLAGLGFQYRQALGDRWTLFEELEVHRDTNPDLHGGLTTALRQPAYHTIFNRVAAAFDVSPLWQLEGGYAFTGIDYSGNSLAEIEERNAQAIGIESRREIFGSAALLGSYEVEFVDFERAPLDYTRHETLAGMSTGLGDHGQASVAAGAQFRRGGSGRSSTTPAAEASLEWGEPTTHVRWLNRYGQFDHELALLGFDQREGYQSLLEANHALDGTTTLHASAGVLASQFESRTAALDETAWTAHLGASWQLLGDLDLNAGYHFVRLDSPLANRDYTRQQVDIGVIRTF